MSGTEVPLNRSRPSVGSALEPLDPVDHFSWRFPFRNASSRSDPPTCLYRSSNAKTRPEKRSISGDDRRPRVFVSSHFTTDPSRRDFRPRPSGPSGAGADPDPRCNNRTRRIHPSRPDNSQHLAICHALVRHHALQKPSRRPKVANMHPRPRNEKKKKARRVEGPKAEAKARAQPPPHPAIASPAPRPHLRS